jgi:HTH-type transcriptional regulator/antitoxin HigA
MKTGLAFAPKKYGHLLVQTLPCAIKTDIEHERLLKIVAQLMEREEEELSPEEGSLLDLLVTLIECYEAERYPRPASLPHELLQHLMEARGLRQRDLLAIFGSRGLTSEVVNGKRQISKAQAKKLATFFHVSADLFL